METYDLPGEWQAGPDGRGHFVEKLHPDNKTTLCGTPVPIVVMTSSRAILPITCSNCLKLKEEEQKPEAQLLQKATNHLWLESTAQAKSLACYIIKLRRDHESQLAEVRQRIERLFRELYPNG